MKHAWMAVAAVLVAGLAHGQTLLDSLLTHELRGASALRFSPDGALLGVAVGASVYLIETEGWGVRGVLEGHEGPVSSLAFTADAGELVSGSWDQTVRVWGIATGETTQILPGASSWVVAVAVHPGRTWVLAGSYDSRFKMGMLVWTRLDVTTPLRTKLTHSGWVRAVAFSPDGLLAASGADDKTVKLWNAVTADEIRTLTGHPGAVHSVAFSPDGGRVVAGSWREAVVWEVPTGTRLGSLGGHRGEVRAVAWSPDGRFIATGSADGHLRLWNATTLQLVEAERVLVPITGLAAGGVQGVLSVSFNPDGSLLAASGSDGYLRVWRVGSD